VKAHLSLGAPAPGGLALPAANPTPSQFYGPRGVFLDGKVLIVADSGNHRVLIWSQPPTTSHQPADVVLGQPDFYSEGPNRNRTNIRNGFFLPTSVAVFRGKLFVADAWNHRILVWNSIPLNSDVEPDYAIGQPDLSSGEPNQGKDVSAATLYWPYGMAFINGRFYVADTGNRRVLVWSNLPASNQPADIVLGQDDFSQNRENRNVGVGPSSFRWPHALAGTSNVLYAADAGNHRILGWRPAPSTDRPADFVLGQPSFDSASEFPYAKQSAQKLRFPYDIACNDEILAVSDTANNRILLWNSQLPQAASAPAIAVLGQPDFASNGENHWKAVSNQTLCWPYGICLHESTLAVADSGNNRVMIWDLREVLNRCAEISEQRSLLCV
jgi:hypothetical protein